MLFNSIRKKEGKRNTKKNKQIEDVGEIKKNLNFPTTASLLHLGIKIFEIQAEILWKLFVYTYH